MKRDFISRRPSAPEKQNEPKVLRVVLEEFFQSDEPLAVAFRHRKAYATTEPCVDLKLLTQKPGHLPVGECLEGVLTHDGTDHFRFVEDVAEKGGATVVSRNPIVYAGACINVHRRDDGSLYPTFRHPQLSTFYTFRDFCREAAEELLMMAGLGEEEE